jgi:cyclopropane-fatty-acyl-phospholipid synthase
MTPDITLRERSILPTWEGVVATAIDCAERGWLPDAVVRAGIRRFVRERLAGERRSGTPPAAFAERLKAMPIAMSTAAANRQHYEVPAEFFVRVLGPRLKYSCTYWPAGTTTLPAAEEAMLALTAERAGVADGMDVLDLGCGWGSFSLWLAERCPNARIVAVSNSAVQRRFIEDRAAMAGRTNLRVVTADVNALELAERFDRVVSIEMFEHVRNYQRLLARIHGWLRPGGQLFVHHFCHRRHVYLYETEGASNWMAREFFTGGTMPSFDLLAQFQDDLRLQASWWVDGTEYARTAEAWLANLDRARDDVVELFQRELPGEPAERLVQRWRMFFLGCAETFAIGGGREWGVAHHRMARG